MAHSQPPFAQHYHDRTKYTPAAIAAQNRQLDWANQPLPFKDYKVGRTINLKPYLDNRQPEQALPPTSDLPLGASAAVSAGSDSNLTPDFWYRLSRFLLNSYGITATITPLSGDSVYLRAAPSAGGLYPAELYLISRGTPELAAGLYHYDSRAHRLRQFWDAEVWTALQSACCWHPALLQTQLAVVTTAVYFRSVWRYQARAYRRICLDSGHLWGNLELASMLVDFRLHLIGGFRDELMNQLLYLDSAQEGVMAIAALTDRLKLAENLSHFQTTLPSSVAQDYAQFTEGELVPHMVQATTIATDLTYRKTAVTPPKQREDKAKLPFGTAVAAIAAPLPWGDGQRELERTILKRRSTRRYTGLDLELEQVAAILGFAYHPELYLDQQFDPTPDYFDLSLISTFVVALGVNGLDPGCYGYVPGDNILRQVRFKVQRQAVHQLCLGQDLGRDAGAIIVHSANLATAIARHGDRAYRYLHLDAGHLGQRLNLAAIRLGLGASGIAGFYDDQVNDLLGISPTEAVLYLTTLGQPR